MELFDKLRSLVPFLKPKQPKLVSPLPGPISSEKFTSELKKLSASDLTQDQKFQESERLYQRRYPNAKPLPQPKILPNLEPKKVQAQFRRSTPTPTPTRRPKLRKLDDPKLVHTSQFDDSIKNIWRGVDPTLVNTVARYESSFQPNMIAINDTGQRMRVTNRETMNEVIGKFKNVDIGLMQINTDAYEKGVGSQRRPIGEYLASKGLDWFDLLDPEINLMVAHDLYQGRIPGKAGGWQNWHAIRNNNLQRHFGLKF